MCCDVQVKSTRTNAVDRLGEKPTSHSSTWVINPGRYPIALSLVAMLKCDPHFPPFFTLAASL